MKLDHIGVAVRSIEQAVRTFQLLGFNAKEIVSIQEQGVRVALLPAGESRIELLEPLGDQSVIQKFLDSKGEGIHHLCFCVQNLAQKLQELSGTDLRIVDQPSDKGYGNRKVAFLHPKGTHGVLIELVEEP